MANTIANVLVGVAQLWIKYPVGGSYVHAGFTEDGVNLEYSVDESDIEVEELTFPIKRVITKETGKFTCNMAESSLYNIDKAIAGSVLAGSVISIGGGANKEMAVKVIGTNPAGYDRTIEMALATANGSVGMSYKKGEKTVVPITFEALDNGSDEPVVITDSES